MNQRLTPFYLAIYLFRSFYAIHMNYQFSFYKTSIELYELALYIKTHQISSPWVCFSFLYFTYKDQLLCESIIIIINWERKNKTYIKYVYLYCISVYYSVNQFARHLKIHNEIMRRKKSKSFEMHDTMHLPR